MPLPLGNIPPGPWAVGVSGGADSTALLLAITRQCPHVHPHVIHLNHQTRGGASDADAAFVADLATRLNIPCTIARLSDLPTIETPNPSARYRAARLALFSDACRRHSLTGVLLAHHAGDQAETVLQRLLRGSSFLGLTGIAGDQTLTIPALRMLRPLLDVPRTALRDFLLSHNQPWREDASNASDDYARNRVRKLLARHPHLTPALCDLARHCRALADFARAAAPALPAAFPTRTLADLPDLLADVTARRWLYARGLTPDDITPPVVARLLTLARDAASPPTTNLPRNLIARRRRGAISVDSR